MTSDDERAATERMRLLLVHDADSESRNLAPEPDLLEPNDENADLFQGPIDLSLLKVSRFAARAIKTRETEGHRQAVYSASTEPVAKAPPALALSSVLLTEPTTEPALASVHDIAAREAATVRRREIPVRDASRDCDTVPEGRQLGKRVTKRYVAIVAGFFGAAVLLAGLVASVGNGPRTPSAARTSAVVLPPPERLAPSAQAAPQPRDLPAAQAPAPVVSPLAETTKPTLGRKPLSLAPQKMAAEDGGGRGSNPGFQLGPGLESETTRF